MGVSRFSTTAKTKTTETVTLSLTMGKWLSSRVKKTERRESQRRKKFTWIVVTRRGRRSVSLVSMSTRIFISGIQSFVTTIFQEMILI